MVLVDCMPFLAFPICLSGFPGEVCATFGCFLGHRATPLITTRQPESLPRLKGLPQVMMRMTNMDPAESCCLLILPFIWQTNKNPGILFVAHTIFPHRNSCCCCLIVSKIQQQKIRATFWHYSSTHRSTLRLLVRSSYDCWGTRADHKGKTPENTHNS